MKSDSETTFPDEMIFQFLAFTGSADSDVAKGYLEMSGGDLETAVGLFLDNQNSGPRVSPSTGVPITEDYSSSHGSRANRNRSTKSRSDWVDEDGIRAPDQSQRMRLLDFDDANEDDSEDLMSTNQITEMLMRSQAAVMQNHLSSAFASDASLYSGARTTRLELRDAVNRAAAAAGGSGDVMPHSSSSSPPSDRRPSSPDYHDDDVEIVDSDDDEVNVVGSSQPASAVAGPKRLTDMFAPPLSLIYMGPEGFQGAKRMAKDSKRWLLVNLQRDSDFACHALNRDVWRDELVDNLIRAGFIFWQTVCLSIYYIFQSIEYFSRVSNSFCICCIIMMNSLIQPLKDKNTHTAIKLHLIPMLQSSTLELEGLCGGRKVGRRWTR